MLTSTLLATIWLIAAVMSGLATFAVVLRSRGSRFEAVVAALLIALISPPLAASWVLLLPLRFSVSFVLGCVCVILTSLLLLRRYGSRRIFQGSLPSTRHVVSVLPATVALLSLGAISIYAARLKPMWEIDGLLYHGPSIANLLQHGALFGWDAPSQWIFYPNLTAITGAAVAVATQSVDWVDATQAPYLIVLGLIAWAWGGRGKATALAGAIAVLAISTPAAFIQARALYVDVAYAAMVVGSLWMMGLWISRRSRGYLAIGSLLLGTAAATKAAGATIAIALLVIVVAIILFRRRRQALRTLGIAFGATLLGGTPFYLRNVIEFGNPLYPVKLDVLGWTFPGPASLDFLNTLGPPELLSRQGPVALVLNLVWSVTRSPAEYIYDTRLGGFGPITAILLVLLAASVVVVIVRALQHNRAPLRAIGWPVIAGAILLALQAQAWNPRYALSIFILLAIVAALGLSYAGIVRSVAFMMSLGLLAITGALAWSAEDVATQSIRFSNSFLNAHPGAQHGVSNNNPAYQDSYKWVAGLPCGTRVLVASTDMQIGLLNAYSYPMWGDALCNQVTVARDTRGSGPKGFGGPRPNLTRLMRQADFVVAFEADRALVQRTARALGRRATAVANPPDYYGADQVVFRLEPKAPSP